MTWVYARAALALTAMTLTAVPVSAADEPNTTANAKQPSQSPTLWQPGNSTTSDVEPRVEMDEAPVSGGGDYGRFEGNIDLGLSAGSELDARGPSALVVLSGHYFWMAGATLAYLDALGSSDATWSRLLAVGVDIRPAFVPRWGENHEFGPAFTDLLIDSISLGLGVFWASPPNGSFGDRRGFELSGGFAVPLFARAQGLWLGARGVLRWADPASGDDSAVPAAVLTLAWHQAVQVP